MTDNPELEIVKRHARALCARRGIDADAIVDPVGPVREFDREAYYIAQAVCEVNALNETKVQALVDVLESIKRRCEAFASINLVGRSVNAKEGGTLRNVLQEADAALAAWEGQQ